jgi:hypothetical protein
MLHNTASDSKGISAVVLSPDSTKIEHLIIYGDFGYNICILFFFSFFLHHNIVYSKSPVYNNLNDPGVNIKGPCFT